LNRQARFNYKILDSFEVGLVLTGGEVKSLRAGQAVIQDSYAKIRGGELWLMNAHVTPYSAGDEADANPLQPRKLLIHKEELRKLESKLQASGRLTLVPLKIYITRNRIKLELGLGEGKKKFDKRASIKEREDERSTRRKLGHK